jgi:hypothetical protein
VSSEQQESSEARLSTLLMHNNADTYSTQAMVIVVSKCKRSTEIRRLLGKKESTVWIGKGKIVP